MGNSKIMVGDEKMSPEEVVFLNSLFKELSENVGEIARMVSRYLGKGELPATSCIFTLSYEAASRSEEISPTTPTDEYIRNSVKVRVSYPDGTHGNLEYPPGVSYAS